MKKFKEFVTEGVSDTVYVFDIDDTLAKTTSKIYYTEPDQPEKSVGTEEFASLRTKLHPDTKYDFREFRHYHHIYTGIKNAKPIIPILKYVDEAVTKGYKIGVLTARGNQDAVRVGLKDFLMYKDDKGKLSELPRKLFRKKFIFAVNDPATAKALGGTGSVSNPEQLKAIVLQKIFGDKYGFKNIVFFDDDAGNINKVKALNDPRIKAIKV